MQFLDLIENPDPVTRAKAPLAIAMRLFARWISS
jgi:hypothetical protein